MKICIISTPVFKMVPPHGTSGYSGLEVIAWQSAKGLAARGHQVSLVGADGSECSGVQIIPIGPAGMTDEKNAYDKYWQRLFEFDCIIDHSWGKWSNCLKAEGRLKAPVLNVLHAPVDTMFKKWPPQYPSFPMVEKSCPVCISDDQRIHFENLFGYEGRTCHNGVDTDQYKEVGCKRTNRFLFLARFSTIKGPDIAIEACKKAGVGLDLVGDISITNEPEYLEHCKRMCDGKQIRMVGPCSRSETVWWYSQAHCMLHPNKRFREPFGLAPIEAMLCGCPVIAWNHGAMRETIKHAQTGWLVKSVEEMIHWMKLSLTPECNDGEMRIHSREWAAHKFSIENMVNRYEQLCQEAVDGGGW